MPEAADRGLGRARALARGNLAPAHFQERRCRRAAAGAALDEFVDAAVFQRHQPGGAGQVGLHGAHRRRRLVVIPAAEIEPEQFGLVDAARHEEAYGQGIQGELEAERRKDRLDGVGYAVVEFVPGFQQLRAGELRIVARRVHLAIACVRLKRCPLGIADVVPAAVGENDPAVHVEPVDPERRVEGMQDRRVIGIADVLRVKLPVVVDDLAVIAEQAERPVEIPFHMARHRLAEERRDRLGRRRKRAEHQAAEHLHPKRFQAVLGRVEVVGHAALAAHAVLEGDALQPALQVIGPGVIDARERLAVVPFLEADQRALVGAAVDHRMHRAVVIAGDDDRDLADEAGLGVARPGDVDFQAEEMPDRTAKDPVLLEPIDLRVGKQPKRNAGDAAFWPIERRIRICDPSLAHDHPTVV